MSTTAAQRRGKPINKAGPTVLIENGSAEPAAAPNKVLRATVRRNFFGTGPFDKYWLNLDCCGLFCSFITYSLHMYAVYVVCTILLPPWMSVTAEDGTRSMTTTGIFHQVAFSTIAAMAIISHFYCMITDPGTVPPDAKPLEEDDESEETTKLVNGKRVKRLCRRCRAFKPQRAHHCSVCRRCVIKMDHHCPWVNNCVGIGNHKYFLLFIFYTFLSCSYSMLLVIARFTTCAGDAHHHHGRYRARRATCLDKPTQLISILGLLIEGLLFGMFTSCMMFDQSDVIFSKMTHIDKLKGTDIGGSIAGVTEVFGIGPRGTRFRPDWLSPFYKVCFPASVRDEVMGFCRPCGSNGGVNKPATTTTPVSAAATELAPRTADVV